MFDEVHEAVLLLRQTRTRIPKKILGTLSDLSRRKVLKVYWEETNINHLR